MALLAVDENSALAGHSKDAERREFKKSKPSVQDFLKKDDEILEILRANSRCFAIDSHPDIFEKDAEKVEANSRCIAMDSHLDISKKDAETPESNSSRFFDWIKKLKHSKKANNSPPDISEKDGKVNSRGIDYVKKHIKEFEHSGKAMKSQPDILKKLAEKLEAAERPEAKSKCIAMNSHQDIFKKSEGVEVCSKCIDELKNKFEKTKKAMNSHPDNLKKVENVKALFEYLDFWQEHSEKLVCSVKVPISTKSDDEIENKMAPPLTSRRHDLILEWMKSKNKSLSRFHDEAERTVCPFDASDEVKKAAKDILERFQSGESCGSVFSDLMTAQ